MIKKKMNKKISGLSLLEALISTAIVGIGFIAILQMTNFSVQSIDSSGERTKANYIAGTIAEDIYAFKNQEASNKTFVDSLKDTEWKSDKCEAKSAHTFTDSTADGNIRKKWSSRVSKNYLKCVDDTDKKNLQVIQLCHSGCTKSKNLYFDKMYIGRMEINMQKATKKKYLYFQIK